MSAETEVEVVVGAFSELVSDAALAEQEAGATDAVSTTIPPATHLTTRLTEEGYVGAV